MASDNYFQLFGLSPRYVLDNSVLEKTWRELAAKVHPDRYATASPAERRVAMQWASTINEAYRVLKTPLNRARYLCELSGCDLQAENNTRMDEDFLIRQMEWREQLDDAREQHRVDVFDSLEEDIRRTRAEMHDTMIRLIDQKHDYEQASGKVREWMFVEKFFQEVQSAHHDLNDRKN